LTETVSVVIPTRGRPQLLARAIRSVLAQTTQQFEIIVVLDGPDSSTAKIVEAFADSRIRLVTLPRPAGGGTARNAGVSAASGNWIAFLDDDDEFLPRKLELQLGASAQSPTHAILIVSQALVRSASGDQIWPSRFPQAHESTCEYLFCRTQLKQGSSFFQSSTFFVSRKLALQIPFRPELNRHQDWDWVIRVLAAPDTKLICLAQPLSIYYLGPPPAGLNSTAHSVSCRKGWKESLHWGREVVLTRSRSAYSFLIATQCVTRLERSEGFRLRVFRLLARECFLVGKPSLMSGLLFAGFWIRRLLPNPTA
jgi:glycosyltransferase involved in cell wall biosynthesis